MDADRGPGKVELQLKVWRPGWRAPCGQLGEALLLGGNLLPDPGQAQGEPCLQGAETVKVRWQIGHAFESTRRAAPHLEAGGGYAVTYPSAASASRAAFFNAISLSYIETPWLGYPTA